MGKTIRERIVFVLGAGAHIPYGFPSGIELRDELLDHSWIDNNSLNASSIEFHLLKKENRSFTTLFRDSSCLSIDAFIESRREFTEHATILLLSILLRREEKYRINFNRATDWFEYLWQALNCSPDQFLKHEVTFLTFNYDRLLEHKLARSLASSHDISTGDATKLIEQKRMVVHLHGSLAPLPNSDSLNSSDCRLSFGSHNPTYEDLKRLAIKRPIRFFWEEHDNADEWAFATNRLHEATKVFVFGVGSASIPLKHLWQGGPRSAREFSTRYVCIKGLRAAAANSIRSAMAYTDIAAGKLYYPEGFEPKIPNSDGCLEVLQDYFDVSR